MPTSTNALATPAAQRSSIQAVNDEVIPIGSVSSVTASRPKRAARVGAGASAVQAIAPIR